MQVELTDKIVLLSATFRGVQLSLGRKEIR